MSSPRLADDALPPRSRRTLLLRFVVCLVVVLLALGAAVGPRLVRSGSAGAAAAVPAPAVPAGLPAAIEPYAQYVPQNTCDPVAKPGTLDLANLLVRTYPNTTYNTVYACGTDGGVSEHYDGRAIDWMNSLRNPTQAAQATAFLHWLFAPDAHGNTGAMFRRLGIMYIVWDNRIWGSWNQQWDPYDNCAATPQTSYDNACHRSHMHISLSWEGARAATSFWSKRVAATDYGPCIPAGMNQPVPTSTANPLPCPAHSAVSAPAGSSGLLRALYTWSGIPVSLNQTGAVVSVIQQAVGAAVTGTFSTATQAAVLTFQRTNALPQSGRIDVATWRALLASMDPRVTHRMQTSWPN